MIKYSLVCENGHEFESWFAGSDAYDRQEKQGLVQCAVCQSPKVTKAIMAPALAHRTAEPRETSEAPQQQLLDTRQRELRAALGALREKMLESSVNVGASFSDEARRMHEGETTFRTIHGEATPAHARALIEDGIGIIPIPPALDELN